ncbi:hypothetical protein L3Q82_025428 [Scortum barcoo]|uniref:Uncharacterized protein n=1 Tax=Scortum barcoo TaxID=214431 RepID=A0ACB8WLR3_9TELE|nr:hypothetical protein L3Q82_025428 [Scortum barcoo]
MPSSSSLETSIHASPSSSLPKFTQYVTCHTRDNKTLDLFYANTKEAYHSLPLPPLGRADHNLVHLLPVYKTLVHRQPAVTRTVKKWSEEAEEALKDCFNTTLWDVFSDAHGEDIDSLTHCLTDYINFCVENTVPTRTVRSFSNSKPWITPDIKALLKEKRRAFVSGNKEELKSVQRELRRMIRKGKDCYRRKMEHQLQQNNICGVWKGLKTISGFKEPKSQPVGDQGLLPPVPLAPPVQPPHPLSRPSVHTYHYHPSHNPSVHTYPQFTPTWTLPLHTLSCAPPPSTPPCSSLLPHNTPGYTFNLSLKLGRVPQLWKTSCIVPVPKTPHPKELNSYRPVALTSHLMKTLERLVLGPSAPAAQAAGDKLQLAGVDHHLTTWILDYLTHRPQFVRVQGFESDRLLCSTGAPQGTVLAPFLFTLYTADFSYNTPSCHLQKFSDDSAVVGLITDGDDREYRGLIQDFADWCLRNNLQINAGKTKELVVDFRRRR